MKPTLRTITRCWNRNALIGLSASALFVSGATRAVATEITFDFNDPLLPAKSGNANGAVQSYINNLLSTAGIGASLTTVTGAGTDMYYYVSGSTQTPPSNLGNYYKGGDRQYVIGPYVTDGSIFGYTNNNPNRPKKGVIPIMLGNSDGTWDGSSGDPTGLNLKDYKTFDNYLINAHPDTKISMTFDLEDNWSLVGARFDYEIFPNSECSDAKSRDSETNYSCGDYPDFSFVIGDGNASRTTVLQQRGIDPENAAIQFNSNSSSQRSNRANPETAPQFIGQTDTILFKDHFQNPVSVLEFVDWPQRIGIDNLTLLFGYTPPPVLSQPPLPEPSSLLLTGIGLLGLGRFSRARRRFNPSKA